MHLVILARMTPLSDPLWGSRATAAGRLAHDVAWRIVRGEIAAGEMLTEVQLSTEAGISRTPAREALLQLESWGLVRLLPKKGAAVQALTPQSVADLTALRGLLESTALATVAARPDAVGPLVATLTANLEQQRAALDAGDLAAFSALDVRFHRDVIATCGNAAFDEVVRTFAPAWPASSTPPPADPSTPPAASSMGTPRSALSWPPGAPQTPSVPSRHTSTPRGPASSSPACRP